MNAVNEERAPGPPVGWFVAKMVFSVVWLMACAFAARALLRSDEGLFIIAAALLLVLGPVTWLLVKTVSLARADEAERSVMLRGWPTACCSRSPIPAR